MSSPVQILAYTCHPRTFLQSASLRLTGMLLFVLISEHT